MKIGGLGTIGVLMLGLVIAVISVAGCAQPAAPAAKSESKPAPAAKRDKMTIAYATQVLAMATPKLAESAGFFRDEGLDVEEITLEGGGAATSPALLAGDVDAVSGGGNEVAILHLKGRSDVVGVYSVVNGLTFAVAASNNWIAKTGLDLKAPANERIAKLKGATFGAPSLGGTTEMYIWLILKQGGLKQGDADVIRTGGGPPQIAALESGQIDAFAASPPTPVEVEIRGKGRVVVMPADLPELINYVNQNIYVMQKYAKENPQAVRKAVRGLEKARMLIKNDVEGAAKLLKPKFAGISDEALISSLKLLQDNLVRGGKMTEEQWQNLGKLMKDVDMTKEDLPRKTEGLYWTNEYFN